MHIFGKDTVLVLISRMISTNPISSHILIFVTSHLTTLFETIFIDCNILCPGVLPSIGPFKLGNISLNWQPGFSGTVEEDCC